ncbi:MAG: hypothetical protein ACK5XA_07325 [Tagaea sp.]
MALSIDETDVAPSSDDTFRAHPVNACVANMWISRFNAVTTAQSSWNGLDTA